MQSRTPDTSTLLIDALSERKRKNSAYSLRAFARDLGISPAYLSLLIAGKKNKLSKRVAIQIADVLGLSGKKVESLLPLPHGKATARPVPLDLERFRLLTRWYHLPILDLTTCDNFKSDLGWIARRLQISRVEATSAVKRLIRLGLLIADDGSLKKRDARIEIQPERSVHAIREFHRQMIEKSLKALSSSAQGDFEKREISGITIAADPENVAKARQKVIKFQEEIAALLEAGNRTEVYQLNVQLFPLTKESE